MELVSQDSHLLREELQDFDFVNPPFDPIEFAKELVKFMYDKNGIGIAANQVGVPYKIFAMRGEPENFCCINPKIVWYSEEQITLEEGCLTYPGFYCKVKRTQHIRCRFFTPNGDVRTETFTGMTARIFQHELDHLNGILFFNRANPYHKEQALKRWNKIKKHNSNIIMVPSKSLNLETT